MKNKIKVQFIKPWKGDYFYVTPNIAVCNDEMFLIKLSWFKWNFGIIIYY